METKTISQTAEIIAGMLTENTGRHMLDSGGDSGRHWQLNQGLTAADFIAMPYQTLEDGATISVFHWLNERVSYAPELDSQFQTFSAASENSYYEDIAEFLQVIGAEITGECNTYNYDSALSQTLQFTEFNLNGDTYALLQIHGGADVRGGYTKPRVFEVWELLWDFGRASVNCRNCEFYADLTGGYSVDYVQHGGECPDDCQGTDRQYPNRYRPDTTREWQPGDNCPCCGGDLY